MLPAVIGETLPAAIRSWRSVCCQACKTQKARVAVAGSNGCGQGLSTEVPMSSRIAPARWVVPPEPATMFFFTARDCLTSTVSKAMNSSASAW